MTLEDAALKLLGVAVDLAPTLASWFADSAHGKDDWWSVRIKEILPESSKSAAAMRALGGKP